MPFLGALRVTAGGPALHFEKMRFCFGRCEKQLGQNKAVSYMRTTVCSVFYNLSHNLF